MYQSYFGLNNAPFSIVPDHRVMYMSDSHREAVAHLLYSLKQPGGFVQLTGEVGTGKTTISRYLLQHLPENVDVALLLNPRVNELELLESICDELGIRYPKNSTLKNLIGVLNIYLLESHSSGRHTVLIIDEAQNLAREVLEQIRLLTNLETSSDKLLQIILIGQPELKNILKRHDLRQLSQRIVGRFNLDPLNLNEAREYISFRLQQAGCERVLFTRPATRRIQRLSKGVPRLINVLCDSALMGAYSENKDKVSYAIVNRVAKEVLPEFDGGSVISRIFRLSWAPLIAAGLVLGYFAIGGQQRLSQWVSAYWPGSNQDHTLEKSLEAQAAPLQSSADPINSVRAAGESVDSKKSTTAQKNRSTQTDGKVGEAIAVVVESQLKQADTKSRGSPEIPEPSIESSSVQSAVESNKKTDRIPDTRFDLVYRLGVPFKDK